jgi:hypothetical protein
MSDETKSSPKVEAKPAPAAHAPAMDPATLALATRIAAEMANVRPATPTRIDGSDQTAPGGKFMVEGVLVNAWGQPFKEGQDPSADNPDAPKFR